MNVAVLLSLAARTPELPGAVCVDPAVRSVFDAAADVRATRAVAEAARTCASCPALQACRAWVQGLPAGQRPRGVVGGLAIADRTGRCVPL